MTMKTIVAIAAAALAFGLAHAQDYPTKTIRLIIPLTPGSGADIAGRTLAAASTREKELRDQIKKQAKKPTKPGHTRTAEGEEVPKP